MNGCPNVDCKENIEEKIKGLCDYVYGHEAGEDIWSKMCRKVKEVSDKIQDVSECCRAKIPKKWAWIVFLTFGASLITGGYNIYYRVNVGHLEFVAREEAHALHEKLAGDIQANKIRIEVMKSEYAHICQALADLKTQNKEILDKAQNLEFKIQSIESFKSK